MESTCCRSSWTPSYKNFFSDLARCGTYPIITYLLGFNSRSKLDIAFSNNGLKPNVVLDAVDTDVIKTYVRLGFGVGIIASPAFSASEDSDLVALEGIEIFPGAVTEIILRPGTFTRIYARLYRRICPHLRRDLVADFVLNDGKCLRTQL